MLAILLCQTLSSIAPHFKVFLASISSVAELYHFTVHLPQYAVYFTVLLDFLSLIVWDLKLNWNLRENILGRLLSRKLQKTKSRLRKVHCREDARALFPIYHDIDRDKAEEAKSCQSHQSQPLTKTPTKTPTKKPIQILTQHLKLSNNFFLLICKKQSLLLALDSWLLLHFPSERQTFC